MSVQSTQRHHTLGISIITFNKFSQLSYSCKLYGNTLCFIVFCHEFIYESRLFIRTENEGRFQLQLN